MGSALEIIAVGVLNDRAVGAVGKEKSAILVQAFNGGIGTDLQTADQRRAVHDDVQMSALGRAVKQRLQCIGVVGAAARIDVAVKSGEVACVNHVFHIGTPFL